MMKLATLLVLYLLIPGAQVVGYIRELPFISFPEALNYISSIISFYAVFNHLLISVKIPRLQRFFPYDRMVKFHAISGVILTVTIYFHGAFKIISGKYIDLSTWLLLALWTVLLFAAILWIETPLSRKLRKVLVARVPFFGKIPYDLMKRVHGYLFILFGIMTYTHVSEADLMYSSSSFISGYASYYPLAVMAIVIYARIRSLLLPKLRVTKKRIIGDTVVLTLVPLQKGRIAYRAGQFGYLRILGNRFFEEEHPFSFLSTPHEEEIQVGIKMVGDYTKRVGQIEEGTTIRINGGFGDFIPDYAKGDTVLIGSGIGIVPLLSLLRDMGHGHPKGQVTAFLAVNQRDELLIEEELKQLHEEIDPLDIKLFIFSEDGILYHKDLFDEHIANPAGASYFICSSPGVRTIVCDALASLGVHKKQIYFEAFSF